MSNFKFTSATAQECGFAATVLAELDAYYDTMVLNGELPGHIMLLARGDKLVRGHVTGFANWFTKEPLIPDSIFPLFSMSKPLAAIAMLLLHEAGHWQLDDPVSLHLPEFADIENLEGSGASRGPTIRETFTHTAGFSMGRTPEEFAAAFEKINWATDSSLKQYVARIASMPLAYEPGTAWEYNIATDLQSEIVERISGERYDQFLKRRVFDPLGLSDTAFVLDYDQGRRLVRSHVFDPEVGKLRAALQDEQYKTIFPMGGTSFYSTALDFALLVRMLLNRGSLGDVQILKPESIDLMLSNLLSNSVYEARHQVAHYVIGQGNGYGMNGMVCVDPALAGRLVGKGTYEWGGAYGTWFWIDPEHDILCIGMTNRRRIPSDPRPPEVVAQEIVYRSLCKRSPL